MIPHEKKEMVIPREKISKEKKEKMWKPLPVRQYKYMCLSIISIKMSMQTFLSQIRNVESDVR
jgi:hypothetical protein